MKDPIARRENVRREVSDEGNISIVEGVVKNESVKARALKDHDVSTSIVEVSGERIFEVVFSQLDVDTAESGRAGSW